MSLRFVSVLQVVLDGLATDFRIVGVHLGAAQVGTALLAE